MSDLSQDWLNSPKNDLLEDIIKEDKNSEIKKNSNNYLSPNPKKKTTENSIFQSSEKPLFPLGNNSHLKMNHQNSKIKLEEFKNKKIISDPFQSDKFSDKNPSTNVIIIKDNENVREKSFQKQVSKIKFFWRGTNFNYPYTFLKFFPEEEKCQLESDENFDPNHYCFEDYSKKKINPSEKFYN